MTIKPPSTIIWIFTTKCNLRCRHCYAYRLGVFGELKREEKLHLIDVFAENNIEYIGLSGGEPLVHPDTRDIVEKASLYGIEVGIVTNGTFWNNDVINAVKKYDVFLYISLDGPKNIHEAIRGTNTFNRVMEFIEQIKIRGIDFALVVAVNNINYKYVDYIIDLGVKLDANHVAIIPVMPSGRALENKMFVTRSNYIDAIKIVDKKSREQGYPVALWCTPFAPLITRSRYIHSYFCRTYSVLDIDPAGNMLLCDIIDFRIGSIRNTDFRKAWQKYVEDPLVKTVVEPPNPPQPCRKCQLLPLCKGGCFARSYLVFGDFNKGDPLCPILEHVSETTDKTS